MKFLYISVLALSVVVPFSLSFDRKVAFYRSWKYLFPSLIMVGLIYLFFDVIFARRGVWGFSPDYTIGFQFLGLPVEEWLFFIAIPYACIFIHYVFIAYFPGLKAGKNTVRALNLALLAILLPLSICNYDRLYTMVNFSLMTVALIIAWTWFSELLERYYLSFLVMLIPFIIVNGILTGTLIDGEVVWYNDNENLGLRLLTVPVEDIGYTFSLMLLNLMAITGLSRIFEKRGK